MIVRCGRCRVELEVTGPGEFLCPSCGTRNTVRAQQQPASPFADLTPPPTDAPPANVSWVTCPACRYRFAVGEVARVACPTCGHESDTGSAATGSDVSAQTVAMSDEK